MEAATVVKEGVGRRPFIRRFWDYAGSGKGRLAIVYSAVFACFLIAFSSGLIVNGRSFIWFVDGLEQQYMFFIMQGEWLREFLSNIFVEHNFTVPMWSDRIGYGADYLLSIQNTFGNPINWISVFFTPQNAEYGLQLTIPVTLYLAGLSFLGYCTYKGFGVRSSLIASFVYIFGGYSAIVFTQNFMIYPLILGPLVLWGVDKVFDRRNPVLFVVAMALCFFCSVSMAYTSCLLLLVYCLVKVFSLPQRTTAKSFFVWLGKIVGLTALGALIGSVLFIPGAITILSQERIGLDRPSDILYSFSYYIAFVGGFINLAGVGEDCYYGFAPIALICVAAIFAARRRKGSGARSRRIMLAMFVILTAFLCLPFFGRISNGFAYANNRWSWAYMLLVACMVAYGLPILREELSKGRKAPLAAAVGFALLFLVVFLWYAGRSLLASIGVLMLTMAVCYATYRRRDSYYFGILCTVLLSSFVVFFQFGQELSPNQVGLTRAYENAYSLNPSSVVAENVEDPEDSVYDYARLFMYRNGNWANAMQARTFYNSIYNSGIDDYHTSLGLATSSMNFSYSSLNSRTTLEALGGTDYFVTLSEGDTLVPPLFDVEVTQAPIGETMYAVYGTEYSLPLAFLYDSAISSDRYKSLGIMERQDALTQKVVVEDAEGEALLDQYTFEIPSSLSFEPPVGDDDFQVSDTVSPESKAAATTIDGNTITVRQPNTVLYLAADIPAGTEAYFACEGMDFRELSQEEQGAGAQGFFAGIREFQNSLLSRPAKECKIIVYGDGMVQEIWFMNNRHHLYGGKDDWAVNTGYSDQERKGIALQFDTPGVYSFESYGVFATDIIPIASDIEVLVGSAAHDIEETPNGVRCSVDVPTDGEYLYFRIPYGAGWSAEVNGQRADILKANLGFMAIRLDRGAYDVVLDYRTPGLPEGALASFAGLLGLAVLAILYRRWESKRDRFSERPLASEDKSDIC